jgi:phage terminase large subunit GpA-like protein
MDEKGEWRAHAPENGPRHRSFHIWSAYSQHRGAAWINLAREFLEVHKDPNLLKTFVNQVLGEVWEEAGEAPEWQRLYDRREKDMALGTPPAWAGLLIGAADVQRAGGGRIELDIWAFGPSRQRALVEHIEIDGSVSDAATWAKLNEQVAREWRSADGRRMRLARVGIDSGDGENTMAIYAWARQHPGFAMALKGREALAASAPIAGPQWKDVTIKGRTVKRGVRLWTVGTSMLKLELYGQLQLDKPVDGEPYPDGFVFLPEGTTDEWIKQLVSEQLVMVKRRTGRMHREWRQTRPRNEALDMAVYARAVAIALGVDRWSNVQWEKALGLRPMKARPAPPSADADRELPTKAGEATPRRPSRPRPNPFTSRGR